MKRIGACDRAAAVLLAGLLSCVSAVASVPTDLTESGSHSDLASALLPNSSDMAGGSTVFSPAVPGGQGGGGWGSAVEPKSAKQQWLSGLAYTGGVVGLAAALAGSGGGGGARSVAAAIIGDRAEDNQPIPEPSSLILAALASSSAIVHLRRRSTT